MKDKEVLAKDSLARFIGSAPCPVCKRIQTVVTRSGRLVIATHDKTPPMRQVCSGSKTEVAES